MGAAASAIDPNASISLDKAKELAGDKWSLDLEEKFNIHWEEKERLTLTDMKRIAPTLFVEPEDNITLETVMELTLATGTEWNEQLQAIFDNNKFTNDDGQEVIGFAKWKTLVPSLFETLQEREVRLAAEFRAMLVLRSEGTVVINYEMYNEEFPISQNSLTAARIDEDYGLTDVMPGCRIRLSTIDSKRRTLYEEAHPGCEAPWVKEDPEGTFQELLAGNTYYCIVIENPEQYKKDMAELKQRLGDAALHTEAKPRQEGCSCLYGNPCQDPYVCLDWDNRWKVAMENGMSQEEIKRAGIV